MVTEVLHTPLQTMIYTTTKEVPIMSWLPFDEVEAGAMEQALHLTRLPFAFHHVALMPDVHQGYGMPVGAVFAAKGYVLPNAVGVDIGCGVVVAQTGLTTTLLTPELLGRAIALIHARIPMGFGVRGSHQSLRIPPLFFENWGNALDDLPQELRQKIESAVLHQYGTLGSGNHFIEIQADNNGAIWVMIHSGSRGMGKMLCDHFNTLARVVEHVPGIVPKWDLDALDFDSEIGQSYWQCMSAALDFAYENRYAMLDVAISAIEEAVGQTVSTTVQGDIHHNYAALETHFGERVVVHRKGAVRADHRAMVIIPGSMETGSFIGDGLENLDSFKSCSHGAGRKLSRGEARRGRTVDDLECSLSEKGILLQAENPKKVLEEGGHAYKDIDYVMDHQTDLVTARIALRPLAVAKG